MVDIVDGAAPPPSTTGPLQKIEAFMAVTPQRARRNSNGNRKRVNGKFAADPDKEAEPYIHRHKTSYRRLRNAAMRLLKHLERMMPPREKDQKATAVRTKVGTALSDNTENASGEPEKDGAATDSQDKKSKEELPPEYGRLLGRGDGVIDGFNTLAQLVIRLIDKERESRDPSQMVIINPPQIDEKEFDRRIEAELDFIAEQRRSAGNL